MRRFHLLPILCLLIISSSVVSSCDYITGKALEAPASNPQQQVYNITAIEAFALIKANTDNPDFIIIDVRTPAEYARGHIDKAVLVNYSSANFREEIGKFDRNKKYLIYCQTGGRSAGARNIMKELGFFEIYNMNAGITDWLSQGFPVAK